MSATLPDDETVERELARIRVEVMAAIGTVRSPRVSTRVRAIRATAIAIGAAVALSAGAFAVVSSLTERQTTARCYESVSLRAPYTEVQVGLASDAHPEWNDPVGACSLPWADGIVGQKTPPTGGAQTFPVPPLVACEQANGVAAVFPSRDAATAEDLCGSLGLAVWSRS